jgi:hypothetical protein
VYLRQSPCASGPELACNDDTTGCSTASGAAHGSRLLPTVQAGTTYFIVVDGYGGRSGTFSLTVAPPGSAGTTTTTRAATTSTTQASTTTTTTAPVVSTLDRQVAASADDAEEDDGGDVDLESSDLELVEDDNLQTVGIRFRNVTVPRHATIVDAYLQFQVDQTDSGTTSLRVYGQASDNAAAFTTADEDVSTRPRTGFVTWDPVASWPTEGAAGPAQRTPDLAPVIQQIVDRPGWVSGNAVVVIITGTGRRVAEAYDGESSGAPVLHVEFTP